MTEANGRTGAEHAGAAVAAPATPALTRPEVRLGLLLLAAVALVAVVALVVRHQLRARYHESSWEARVVPGPAGGAASPPFHVEAIFYAGEARLMRPGQPATVSPDAAPDLALPGRVAALAEAPDAPVPFPAPRDASPRRMAVRIALAEHPELRRLTMGLPVTARVYTLAGPRD